MRIQKECMVCYQSVASHDCVACGAVVCDACFDAASEVCKGCRAQVTSGE